MKRKKFLLFSAVFLLPVLIISCLIRKDDKNAVRNDANNNTQEFIVKLNGE